MGVDAKTEMRGVELTDAAAKRIAKILREEPGKIALRVSVEGGGCSGFVLIDDLSLVYMGGSVIDFVDDLIGQSFQVRNPNAVASCGCGTSFSI